MDQFNKFKIFLKTNLYRLVFITSMKNHRNRVVSCKDAAGSLHPYVIRRSNGKFVSF